MSKGSSRRWTILAILTLLAIIPYWRSLGLPFISDDYVQIWLGRQFGPVSGWNSLAADPLYRCRATSLVLTYWTERVFGLNPLAFAWSSLALHILNTWLVLALGIWRAIGWRIAAVAAAFFAVMEAHQEAVIWYAALPELLVFTFTVGAFLMWVRWLQEGRRLDGAATILLFAGALLSKESAVVLVPVMLLPVWTGRVPVRRWIGPWCAAALMAVAYTALAFASKTNHLHFNDGTFSPSAPFWITVARSLFRLYWIWGTLAAITLAACGKIRVAASVALLGLVWAAVTLLPYSFLTYMPFVPSRHIYLPSVGLALLIGAAFVAVAESLRHPVRVLTAAALVVLCANTAYLWTRKHGQFAERAEPTERLVAFARNMDGPVYIHCYPYALDTADYAVRLLAGKRAVPLPGPLTDPAPSGVFCYPRHQFKVSDTAADVRQHKGGLN